MFHPKLGQKGTKLPRINDPEIQSHRLCQQVPKAWNLMIKI